jgi:hypothetical protein
LECSYNFELLPAPLFAIVIITKSCCICRELQLCRHTPFHSGFPEAAVVAKLGLRLHEITMLVVVEIVSQIGPLCEHEDCFCPQTTCLDDFRAVSA